MVIKETSKKTEQSSFISECSKESSYGIVSEAKIRLTSFWESLSLVDATLHPHGFHFGILHARLLKSKDYYILEQQRG